MVTRCVVLQSLVVFLPEEDGERLQALVHLLHLYLGQRELTGAWSTGVTVQVNVPAQVVSSGEDHDTSVVHPLPGLPLPAGQVSQRSPLTIEHG